MSYEQQAAPARRNLPQTTFQNAVESFLLRCRAQNLSPLTIGWYKGLLRDLERFLYAHGIELAKDVTRRC